MNKYLLLISALFVLVLAACGGNNNDKENENKAGNNSNNNGNETEENVTIKVGASSTPHAVILEEAKPILEEKGITLEIEEYEEFVLPNDDVDNGQLDANYFQHIQYLEQTNEDTGYGLVNVGEIHSEPMGAYSKNIADIDSIADGTEVILSNSVSDHGRVLGLFQDAGLITLDEEVEVAKAEIKDIVENPKNLEFTPEYEPAFLPELYETEGDTLVVINTNYAIQAGLDPSNDAIFREDSDSPYVNIVAAKEENKDNEALKTLVDVLTSDEIQDFIVEEFDGAVIPFK